MTLRPSLSAVLLLLLWGGWGELSALEPVRGANETLELDADARTAALGGVRLGLPGLSGGEAGHPASLSDQPGGWFHLTHAEHFLESRYDRLSFVLRPDERDALAFAVARFGTDGIPLTREEEWIEGEGWETFSVSDWVATGAFARRWGGWSVGAALHLLWRELDQQGFGFSTDLSAGWRGKAWRFDAALRRASGSGVVWESGWKEISPPDLRLGAGWRRPLPYFYGELLIGWQSPGIFQKEGKSGGMWDEGDDDGDGGGEPELIGGRAWEEPWKWLVSSSIGLEFMIEKWGVLRFGLPSLFHPSEWSAGGGVRWNGAVTVDYAFRRHPELRSVHQVTLGVFPGKWLKKRDDIEDSPRPYSLSKQNETVENLDSEGSR